MKSQPCILVSGQGYVSCAPTDATHLHFRLPSPAGHLHLPVMIGGTREGTPNWTWNGSVESPTLRPSILTEGHEFLSGDPADKANWRAYRCHVWLNDGKVIFLDDTTHELCGQTVDLVDLDESVNDANAAE